MDEHDGVTDGEKYTGNERRKLKFALPWHVSIVRWVGRLRSCRIGLSGWQCGCRAPCVVSGGLQLWRVSSSDGVGEIHWDRRSI